MHFHPDWPYREETVIEAIRRTGRYRSQFETGISNGGLTAHDGGDRWRWESRLFDRKYDSRPAHERPVYGALDLGAPRGAASRFGSAFLRVNTAASSRATFCYPDSVLEPSGVTDSDSLVQLIADMERDNPDVLDRYVEAHVHGGVDIASDIEAIVLDECFRGSHIHREADLLSIPVEFHPGFRMPTSDLDLAYRGPEAAALAKKLGAELTPDLLGAAARSSRYSSQALKYVWHLLARFG